MVSDLDIYRSASVLIRQCGEDATFEAAMRADSMLEKGDLDASAENPTAEWLASLSNDVLSAALKKINWRTISSYLTRTLPMCVLGCRVGLPIDPSAGIILTIFG